MKRGEAGLTCDEPQRLSKSEESSPVPGEGRLLQEMAGMKTEGILAKGSWREGAILEQEGLGWGQFSE